MGALSTALLAQSVAGEQFVFSSRMLSLLAYRNTAEQLANASLTPNGTVATTSANTDVSTAPAVTLPLALWGSSSDTDLDVQVRSSLLPSSPPRALPTSSPPRASACAYS